MYIKLNESTQENRESQTNYKNSDNNQSDSKNKEKLIPEKHFCEKCNIYQPTRTKHCDQCEKCVHKYDHHCFWIGTKSF